MKKIFTIMFFLSLLTIGLAQAQEKEEGILYPVKQDQSQKANAFVTITIHEYKGVGVIEEGIVVNGNKTPIRDDYKFDRLFIKAKHWIILTYGKDANISGNQRSFTYKNKDYTLLLEFKDGMFKFTFTDEGSISQKKEETIINKLAFYLKNSPLKESL